MVNAMILAPLLYILIIVGTMATFSSLYRKRQAIQLGSMEPWFAQSTSRNLYLSLLHLPDSSPKVPDSVLRAALLRRAIDVIHRAIDVRNAKGPLQALLQRGSVGDDTWTQFTRAENELDAELKEIMEEANSLTPPGIQPLWGQWIFQSAAEMAHNERFQKKVESQKERADELRTWWSDNTAKVRSEFLKSEGIVDDSALSGTSTIGTGASLAGSISPAASTQPSTVGEVPTIMLDEKPVNAVLSGSNSDEDAVLVEAVSTGSATGSQPSTPGGSVAGSVRKKKKGKK